MRLFVTIDVAGNPLGGPLDFDKGGALDRMRGQLAYVHVLTTLGQVADPFKDPPDPYCPFRYQLWDAHRVQIAEGYDRTGPDGRAQVRVQASPTDPPGMWTGMVTRLRAPWTGDSITIPVV